MEILDQQLYYALNALAGISVWLDTLVIFIAKYLAVIVIIAIVLYLLLHKDQIQASYWSLRQLLRRAKELLTVGVSSVLTWGIVEILKAVFAEPRPFTYLDEAYVLFEYGAMDSFPSGHAALFAALSVALFHYHRTLGLLLGGITLLVGVARIIAGVHLPFDVLAGFVLGGGIGYSGTVLLHRLKQRVFES